MRRSAASAELTRQVAKSTPAAYEPTLRSTSVLGVLCMAPSHVEPIASCPFRCLSPLFCMALRRLDSRAVEAAVSSSLPFSLSTSLSSHSAGLETLFSLEQRSLRNIQRWQRVMGLYFVQVHASGFPSALGLHLRGWLTHNGLPVLTRLSRLLFQVAGARCC